jgi:dihydroflavonol-4-reductase
MNATLITGATGFLGKYVVQQLKESGEGGQLRVLCRGPSAWDGDSAVTVVRGDVTSADDLDRAMESVGRVYHLAGVVSRDPAMAMELHRVHVQGTRLVCEAALKHGAERVVVASSSGTVAVSREPVVHNEDSGYKIEIVWKWAYYLSKVYAEKAALSLFERKKLPVVIVNPALLLGPGDDRGSSTGDVAMFLEGQIPSLPTGGMSFVDARDCAAGVIAAMQKGRPGERYLLGGPNWTFRQLVYHAAAMTGLRAPALELPVGVSKKLAPAMRKLMPLVGRQFKLDDETIDMSAYFWYCDSSKAANELGFSSRDPMATLGDTIEDLRRRGVGSRSRSS